MSADAAMSRSVDRGRTGVRAVDLVQHWTKAGEASDGPIRALITGANGFIGRHLAERLLADGKRVRLLVRRAETVAELRSLGAEVVVGGLDDVAALSRAVQGVETVFHLAAMTSALSVEEMLRVNRDGAENVARACVAQRERPLLVQVSSIAAAGPAARGGLRRETDRPAPISDYGRSKLAGEQAAAQFAADLPMTIVRPGIVFGPRNREMLPMFRSIKYVHAHFVAGWRPPALSLIHVDDCVELLLQAAAKGSRLPPRNSDPLAQLAQGRGVYFAAGAEYPDYAELGRLMRTVLHRPLAPVIPLVGPLAWLAAGTNEQIARWRGISNTFNLDKIREATAESWACSAELARRELGFSPPLSLENRLQSTVAWYEHERWL
jgi:nucleoside-diphosphate-sugar epimerase